MKRVKIVDRRVSEGQYAYVLELYVDGKYVTAVPYGDLSYWDRTGSKSIDEAWEELKEYAKEKLGIDLERLKREGKIEWETVTPFE